MKSSILTFFRAFAFTTLCFALIAVGYFGAQLIDMVI